MAKKKPTKKKKPVKRSPTQRTPRKRAKKTSAEKPAKKERRKRVIGNLIGKIPEKVRIKGGKSKSVSKTKHMTIKTETEYEDLEIGK